MEEGEGPRTVEVDGMELHLDPEPDENGQLHTALPPRMESWRRRSAAGAILTGIGLGLKAALEPEREEPSIIMQAAGDPPTDLPVEAELGGIRAGDNVVKIRPWLLAADTQLAAVTGPRTVPGTGSVAAEGADQADEADEEAPATDVLGAGPVAGDGLGPGDTP